MAHLIFLIPASGMHLLHLWKASRIKPWSHLTEYTYRLPACRRVAKAFAANVSRANGILMVPGHAFMTGKDWQRCVIDAAKHFFRGKQPTDKQFSKKQKELTDLALQLRDRLVSNRSTDASISDFADASYNIEVFAKGVSTVHGFLHDVLKSSVIQAWTAYEVLADDLWHGVDAKRPHLGVSWTKDEKRLSGFLSRSRIANAYRFTFRKDNAEILSVVDDSAVHALGIVRNVLVHGAGRIDSMFQKDRKGCPQLSRIRGKKIGYEIPFTGDFFRFLIDPVVSQGFKLVKSVDEWLIRNP